MKILPAGLEDITDLNALSYTAKKHWGYPEAWMELWREALTFSPQYIQEHAVFKLVHGSRIIGVCAIENHRDYLDIGHLWLHPGFMGKGLGRLLLEESISRSSYSPLLRVRVESDPHALGFYQRLGFKKVGEVHSLPKGRKLPVLERSVQ